MLNFEICYYIKISFKMYHVVSTWTVPSEDKWILLSMARMPKVLCTYQKVSKLHWKLHANFTSQLQFRHIGIAGNGQAHTVTVEKIEECCQGGVQFSVSVLPIGFIWFLSIWTLALPWHRFVFPYRRGSRWLSSALTPIEKSGNVFRDLLENIWKSYHAVIISRLMDRVHNR